MVVMSRCEDYPCCGHESGCCPSFDEDGRQTDMKCTCGASVPLDSRVSICEACIAIDDAEREDYQPDWSEYDDDMDGDFDSGMASAGHGTDEDYGYGGDEYGMYE